jgi:predicted amidophosphoribosyltransferase
MDDPIAVLPVGEPPGFPQCPKCPYRLMGPAWICVNCASKTLEAIAPRACPICSQRLEDASPCRNALCRDRNRRIERIDAIAYHSGPLQEKIQSYKYDGKVGCVELIVTS